MTHRDRRHGRRGGHPAPAAHATLGEAGAAGRRPARAGHAPARDRRGGDRARVARHRPSRGAGRGARRRRLRVRARDPDRSPAAGARLGRRRPPRPGRRRPSRRSCSRPPTRSSRAGAVREFAEAWEQSGAEGAIAVRRLPGRPPSTRIGVEGDRVVRVPDPGSDTDLTAAPLWAFDGRDRARAPRACASRRSSRRSRWRLRSSARSTPAAHVLSHETGPTRDLTNPLDLVEENFTYLRGLM